MLKKSIVSILITRLHVLIFILLSGVFIVASTSSIPIYVGKNFHQIEEFGKIKQYDTIVWLTVLYILRALFKLVRNQLAAYLGNHVVMDIRMQVIQNIINSKRSHSLKHYTILSYDLNALSDILSYKTFIFIEDILTLLICFISIAGYSRSIMLCILPYIILIFILSLKYAQKTFPVISLLRKGIDKLTEKVYENIIGQSVIRALNISQMQINKFIVRSKGLLRLGLHINKIIAFYESVLQTIAYFALVSCFIKAGLLIMEEELEISLIIIFVNYMMILVSTSKSLGQILNFYANSRESIIRLMGYMSGDSDGSVADVNLSVKNESVDVIRLENVSLDIDGRHIFHDIYVRFDKGTINAITGGIGVGKSSFLKMLLCFHPYYSGNIYINDNNLKQIESLAYFDKIGFVHQEPFFFNMTIKENILMGRENIDEEYLLEVLSMCGLKDYTKKLDLQINKDSNLLSGGEKQRFALARALLGHPEILLLDDSFNAIDIECQQLILQGLQKNKKDMIIIIVSNLDSVILASDHIYSMSDGYLHEIERWNGDERLCIF